MKKRAEQVDSDGNTKKEALATGICSPCEVSHGETASNVTNLILLRLRSQSRFVCEDAIVKEPALAAGSFTMAPATGIEPVTNP